MTDRMTSCGGRTTLAVVLVLASWLAGAGAVGAATPELEILAGSTIRVSSFGATRTIPPHPVPTAPSDVPGFDLRSTGVIEYPRVSTAFQDFLDLFQNKAFRLEIDPVSGDVTVEFDAWIADRDENLIELPAMLTTGQPPLSITDCGGIPVCFPGATEPFCDGAAWDPVTGELQLVGVLVVPENAGTTIDCAVVSVEIEARLASSDPDGDLDDDGVLDVEDNCPLDGPASQADADADGIGDICDNCPADANPDQADRDGNGAGDACQPLLVNFQPAAATVPPGYVADDGSPLVPPAPFGWLDAPPVATVERGVDPDPRLDTFAETGVPRVWEAVHAPMRLEVEARIGDPALPQGPQRVVAEGEAIFDGTQTAAGSHPQVALVGLPVLDGRLSLDVGGGGGQTVLNDLRVVEAADQPFVARGVNFQPASSTPPPGFEPDSGDAYDPLTGRGWLVGALDTRDRPNVDDPALATFVFTAPPAVFELELPADYYLVKVASGDGQYAQGPHHVSVEGQPWIDGETTSAGEFVEVTGRVLVLDRALTVEIAGGGGNTMLNYVGVASLPRDLDGDGVANVPDNCVDVPNASQADADGDGVGDACNDASDGDGDEWADSLDNCAATPNPSQADGDADGRGDACDCAPADDGSFALPPPVTGVRVSGGAAATVAWTSQRGIAGDDTVSDVLELDLGTLRAAGGFGGAGCLDDDLATTSTGDGRVPAAGEGWVYLVRGENACGSGSWGDAAGVTPDPRDALDAAPPCP